MTGSAQEAAEPIEWEMRPGGMLVQKRDPDAAIATGPLIKIKVSHGLFGHDVSVSAHATFGRSIALSPNVDWLWVAKNRLVCGLCVLQQCILTFIFHAEALSIISIDLLSQQNGCGRKVFISEYGLAMLCMRNCLYPLFRFFLLNWKVASMYVVATRLGLTREEVRLLIFLPRGISIIFSKNLIGFED